MSWTLIMQFLSSIKTELIPDSYSIFQFQFLPSPRHQRELEWDLPSRCTACLFKDSHWRACLPCTSCALSSLLSPCLGIPGTLFSFAPLFFSSPLCSWSRSCTLWCWRTWTSTLSRSWIALPHQAISEREVLLWTLAHTSQVCESRLPATRSSLFSGCACCGWSSPQSCGRISGRIRSQPDGTPRLVWWGESTRSLQDGAAPQTACTLRRVYRRRQKWRWGHSLNS